MGIINEESAWRRKQLKQTNPKEGEKEKQERENSIRALRRTLLNSSAREQGSQPALRGFCCPDTPSPQLTAF